VRADHYVCIVFFVLCTAFFSRVFISFQFLCPGCIIRHWCVGKVKGAPTIQKEQKPKKHKNTETELPFNLKNCYGFVFRERGKW